MGETMLRLSPPAHGRLEHTDALDLNVGGAESNVAVALARLGRRAAWVSALPASPLGRRVSGAVAAAGVDVSGVRFTPDGRVGLYFVEFGAAPRATEVYYDRAGSSCARSLAFDPALLDGARFAVLSGITLGLSAHAREAGLRVRRGRPGERCRGRGRRELPRPPVGPRSGARGHRGIDAGGRCRGLQRP